MNRLGFIILSLGVVTADSDRLIIPTVLLAIGIALITIGKRGVID